MGQREKEKKRRAERIMHACGLCEQIGLLVSLLGALCVSLRTRQPRRSVWPKLQDWPQARMHSSCAFTRRTPLARLHLLLWLDRYLSWLNWRRKYLYLQQGLKVETGPEDASTRRELAEVWSDCCRHCGFASWTELTKTEFEERGEPEQRFDASVRLSFDQH